MIKNLFHLLIEIWVSKLQFLVLRGGKVKEEVTEPLEEVENLNEVLFFTRSIRTVRDGFAVFLLDRKVEEKAGQYDSTSFSALFKGFLEKESWTHLIKNPIKFLVD